jgi:hypothetical protein
MMACRLARQPATAAPIDALGASTVGASVCTRLVFQVGTGVLEAGGDLAFHRRGPSLQELDRATGCVTLQR